MNDRLSVWTIYDRPRDFPDTYVARRHVVEKGGPRVTDETMISTSLEALRNEMTRRGFVCIPRQSGDDPNIVESWI